MHSLKITSGLQLASYYFVFYLSWLGSDVGSDVVCLYQTGVLLRTDVFCQNIGTLEHCGRQPWCLESRLHSQYQFTWQYIKSKLFHLTHQFKSVAYALKAENSGFTLFNKIITGDCKELMVNQQWLTVEKVILFWVEVTRNAMREIF